MICYETLALRASASVLTHFKNHVPVQVSVYKKDGKNDLRSTVSGKVLPRAKLEETKIRDFSFLMLY